MMKINNFFLLYLEKSAFSLKDNYHELEFDVKLIADCKNVYADGSQSRLVNISLIAF